eukprot:CAMPEP_0194216000 /NCGR_PEP_ID=MMETSP0156-20130528/18206_1 /TAXON_ID=33649 /ORGANISM="Thalassionema nitzschioides, Strain L26-B" /LENGTH=484 /DNA_ID=CAMNT_0038944665 /DNA_START=60 /DNA_END=1514 /DNA_ORIENTATION=+
MIPPPAAPAPDGRPSKKPCRSDTEKNDCEAAPTTTTRRRLEIERLKLQATKDLLYKARLQLSKPISILKSPSYATIPLTINRESELAKTNSHSTNNNQRRKRRSTLQDEGELSPVCRRSIILPRRTISLSPTSPEQQFHQDLLLANPANYLEKTGTYYGGGDYEEEFQEELSVEETPLDDTFLNIILTEQSKQLSCLAESEVSALILDKAADATHRPTAVFTNDSSPSRPSDGGIAGGPSNAIGNRVPLPEEKATTLALLEQAARVNLDHYESEIAVYQVRRPYLSYSNNEVFWVSDDYSSTATVSDSTTLEVAAHIKADNSVLVIHHGHLLKHYDQNGNVYHETEADYWLHDVFEEFHFARDAYCSSLVSAALVLGKQSVASREVLHRSLLMGEKTQISYPETLAKRIIEVFHVTLSKLIAFTAIVTTLLIQVRYLLSGLVWMIGVICKWICLAVSLTVLWWCLSDHDDSHQTTFAVNNVNKR